MRRTTSTSHRATRTVVVVFTLIISTIHTTIIIRIPKPGARARLSALAFSPRVPFHRQVNNDHDLFFQNHPHVSNNLTHQHLALLPPNLHRHDLLSIVL
jgi:hypothetical protein